MENIRLVMQAQREQSVYHVYGFAIKTLDYACCCAV
jgi:hypothetical protein